MLKNAKILEIGAIFMFLTGASYAAPADWSGELLKCLNSELGQPSDHVPTQAELEGVTSFECIFKKEDITSISPVADLTSVETLDLSYNKISDISPLSNLTALTDLDLKQNTISDISALSNLTALTTLDIGYMSGVSDISPLSNLSALSTVNLTLNCIIDFTPVSHVANVEGVDSQWSTCGIVNSDFTGNRRNDLLWHNSSTGAVKIMGMNGITPLADSTVVDSSNTNLLPRGIGAFSNVLGKPDILFHNQNSGNLRIWKMDGTKRVENIQVLGSSNTNLVIAGVGNFNDDLYNDIATFNINSGALRIWVMDGTERVDNVQVLTGANTNLVPRGVGDMDGDRIPDIVLRNSNSGKVRVWTMNDDFTRKDNVAVTSSSNTNLELRGVVDINGDGNNDILNYNTNTGKLRAWIMDGEMHIIENLEITQDPDPEWSVRN